MRFFCCILLFPIVVWGQRVDFAGTVKDAATKQPIPYVNISFLNTLIGTSTDEKGRFSLEIDKDMLGNKVHVSSLGYKECIVEAKSLTAKSIFYLEEELFDLKEVIVKKDLGDTMVLNPISSYSVTSGFDSSSTPWVLALYFPNIGASDKYVEKVIVYLRENLLFKRENARFRLRLYAVDPITKAPSKDLVHESLILEANIEKDYVIADFSQKPLSIPREGIFVGLEWLFIPYNWYTKQEESELKNANSIEDRFAPTFGGVYSKDANHKAMVYGMGEWRDFKVRAQGNTGYLVPAISLKIRQN